MPARRLVWITWITWIASFVLLIAACRSPSEQARLEVDRLADHRVADAARFEELLTRGDAATRLAAARAVGRLRAPELAPVVRRALEIEGDSAVRAEQLFALGQIGNAEGLDVVLAQLEQPEPRTRARAAEALGKLGQPHVASSLISHLSDGDDGVRGAALLALARLVGRRSVFKSQFDPEAGAALLRGVAPLLERGGGELTWKAAYALAEIEIPGRLELLLRAAKSPTAETRFFAANGLANCDEGGGAVGGNCDAARVGVLTSLLGDDDASVAVAAARALGNLAPAAVGETALGALDKLARVDRRPADLHRRAAALAVLIDRAATAVATSAAATAAAPKANGSPSSADRATLDLIESALHDRTRLVRAEAMRGEVRLAGAAGVDHVRSIAAAAGNPHERVAAIRALAAAPPLVSAPAREALLALTRDSAPFPASEALDALSKLVASGGSDWSADVNQTVRAAALTAVVRRDFAIVANALDLLKHVGTADDLPVFERALDRQRGSEAAEARANAVTAAAALAGARARHLLEHALDDESAAVRAAARTELTNLEKRDKTQEPMSAVPPPALPPSAPPEQAGSSIDLTADEICRPHANPRVRLHFTSGDVLLELFADTTPRHAKMALERVRTGKCNGLPIHRVVSGFVVQGLDPRGDGWGTGGLFLRDEIGPEPYVRGTIGMPNAGPDSGGCQLFFMLMPAPRLDGRYTAFGRVLQGMEIVEALDLGEVCEHAEVVE